MMIELHPDTIRKQLHNHHAETAAWITETLPVQMVATLTMPVRSRVHVSQERLNDTFDQFWPALQRSMGRSQWSGYIRADELTGQRHIHLAIVDPRPIDEYRVRVSWANACDDYSPKRSHIICPDAQGETDAWRAACYSFKGDGAIFSHNIALFHRDTDANTLTRNDLVRRREIWGSLVDRSID